MNRSQMDLKSLKDVMIKDECDFSIMENPINHLKDEISLDVESHEIGTANKKLMKGDEDWDRKKALEVF